MATNGGYGRGRPRFSDDDRRAIFAAHDRGESATSIARRYECSPGAIYHHLSATLRHIPLKDRYAMAPPIVTTGACIRCGLPMGVRGMCLDCLEVEGIA